MSLSNTNGPSSTTLFKINHDVIAVKKELAEVKGLLIDLRDEINKLNKSQIKRASSSKTLNQNEYRNEKHINVMSPSLSEKISRRTTVANIEQTPRKVPHTRLISQ